MLQVKIKFINSFNANTVIRGRKTIQNIRIKITIDATNLQFEEMFMTNGSSLLRGKIPHTQYRQSMKNLSKGCKNHCCSIRCVDERNMGLPPPDVGGKDPKKYWNATALAYLGDSVWEV